MPCLSKDDDWKEEEDFEWEREENDWDEWGSDEDWGDLDYEGDAVMGGAEEEERSSGRMMKQAVANFDFDAFSLLDSFTTDENNPVPATALPESMAWNEKTSGTSCDSVCISIVSAVASFVFVSLLICLYAVCICRTSYLRLHSSKQSL